MDVGDKPIWTGLGARVTVRAVDRGSYVLDIEPVTTENTVSTNLDEDIAALAERYNLSDTDTDLLLRLFEALTP